MFRKKYSSNLQVCICHCVQIYEQLKSLLFPKMETQIRDLFQLWCFCFNVTLLHLQAQMYCMWLALGKCYEANDVEMCLCAQVLIDS